MKILIYNELDVSRVKKQFEKVIEMIERDDFYSAEVKKLTGTPYYRAKLDYTNRLLFKIVHFHQEKYALLLEVIHQHAYEKSRFLGGAKIDEGKIESVKNNEVDSLSSHPISYINSKNSYFNILDKIISLDDEQNEIFRLKPPIIIIGSAGSGKTTLMLEKMKSAVGEVLYVTGSPFLVQNARLLYYANHYSNEAQEVDFLSYRELLETIQVPKGKEINFSHFASWFSRLPRSRDLKDANKLYEEFKGVLTGHSHQRYLSREDYNQMGIKQSIYRQEERNTVYDLFEKYLNFLRENGFYDTNLLSFDYLSLPYPLQYDFVVIDEVQDFTPVQLLLILKALRTPTEFILCGDSNQIVHPNFFSWAKIKSLFYQKSTEHPTDMIRLLPKNYRNSFSVTVLANKILKAKNVRFGSIDKESHYLAQSHSITPGEIYCLLDSEGIQNEINNKTHKSTNFAILVLREDLKEQACQRFQTPLIFSIYEAKGLEYENVILYHFISSEEKRFRDISLGINPEDLEGEFIYSRPKDKTDRSLEIYKFFINALYVAITRAIKNIYLIEDIEQHPFLNLLDLKPTANFIMIQNQESSVEEWQNEARRLEMQGKLTQAEAIRQTILKKQAVPWSVLTNEAVIKLQESALNSEKKDKAARLLLFEYALFYHHADIMDSLAKIGFAPALKSKKDYDLLERKYFLGYTSSNFTRIMREVSLYGIDFRTVFNQTPLMVACYFGNVTLVKHLLESGANPFLTDNLGRHAFQIALHKAFYDKRFAQDKLASLYEILSPESLRLQINGQLTKIDVQRMEFYLVNGMLAFAHHKLRTFRFFEGFKVDDFMKSLSSFPEIIISQKRKSRSYLSSLLSKHEINRQDRYNRKLFKRIKRGCYVLNPSLMIEMDEKWVNVSALFGFGSAQLEELKGTLTLSFNQQEKPQIINLNPKDFIMTLKKQPSGSTPIFKVYRIYTKKSLFEAESVTLPMIQSPPTPIVDQQAHVNFRKISEEESLYEATLSLNLTTRAASKVLWHQIIEQVGLYTLKGYDDMQLQQILNGYCMNQLYPYACAVATTAMVQGGFPHVYLNPLNFELLYREKQKQELKSVINEATQSTKH